MVKNSAMNAIRLDEVGIESDRFEPDLTAEVDGVNTATETGK